MSIELRHSVSTCCNESVLFMTATEELVCSKCYQYCNTILSRVPEIPEEYYHQRHQDILTLQAEVALYD